jgi:hypothetical protein
MGASESGPWSVKMVKEDGKRITQRHRVNRGFAEKAKRDFSLHRPTRSRETNVEEKASACSARNDSWVLEAYCEGRAQTEVCATV